MIKGIKLPGEAIDKKIYIVTQSCFSAVSESELRLIRVIIEFATNNSITLTPDVSKQIILAAGITKSLFSTSIHRLEKKGILNSMGKTKNLHPVYKDILIWEKILISFSEIQIQN